jgi:GNAT superfamily N-acetyltransferase
MENHENLNKSNFYAFKKLYCYTKKFNSLNEDFFSAYYRSNLFKQYFLRKKVKLLRMGSKYIGYIWVDSFNKNDCRINSICVLPDIKIDSECLRIKYIFKNNFNVIYTCEENKYNSYVLSNLDFVKKSGVFELYTSLQHINYEKLNNYSDISFVKFRKSEKEKLRCDIQNSIFESHDRIPLTEEDIVLDELQNYYIDEGAIFIKKNDEYIGFGQIIRERDKAVIVNFGIIKEYRGRGYGKYFLNYLLNKAKILGFDEVKINVNYNNYTAVNLYRASGFRLNRKIFTWKLKK